MKMELRERLGDGAKEVVKQCFDFLREQADGAPFESMKIEICENPFANPGRYEIIWRSESNGKRFGGLIIV